MIHFVVAVAVALLADMCLAAVGDCLTAGCASDSDVCTSDVCVGGPISLSLSLTSAPLTAAQIEQVETFYRALPDNGVESFELAFSVGGSFTCTSAAEAQQIANALRLGTTAPITCDLQIWRPADCGGGVPSISVDASTCACTGPGAVFRPASAAWGGVGTMVCDNVAQTLTLTAVVECTYTDALCPTDGTASPTCPINTRPTVCGPACPAAAVPACSGKYAMTLGDLDGAICFDIGPQLVGSGTHVRFLANLPVSTTSPDAGVQSLASQFSLLTNWACVFDVEQGDKLARFSCTSGAASISMTQCASASFDDGARKRAVTTLSVTSVGTFAAASGAAADPHLVGANGLKFDFVGAANATYTLFSSPNAVVNMQLAADGPTKRFITAVGVLFGNATFTLKSSESFAHVAPAIDAQIRREGGGGAAVNHLFQLDLALCDGLSVRVTQMHTNPKIASHRDGASINFLNVAVIAPGCHDSFGGALGQTYQCKYALGGEPFAWSRAQEELVRVPSLRARAGAFSNAAAACHERTIYSGHSLTGGTAMHG